ncbi:MAG TPA: hypothetical protein VG056_03000 [Pirellulales bacterium]|nr:hypothetical protein [Pirellulales bacterium]
MPNRRLATAAKYDLPKKKRMTKGRWSLLAVMVLLMGVGVAWAFGYFDSDPRLAEMRELRDKMFDPKTPEKDRFAMMGEAMKKMQALPPDLQEKLMRERPPRMMSMGGPRVDLTLPPDKLMAEVDKSLDQMQERQKMFEQMRKAAAANGPGGPPPGGPPGGGPGGPAGRQNWRNTFLSSVPADSRAQMTIWRELMQTRAAQRGITMPGWGR